MLIVTLFPCLAECQQKMRKLIETLRYKQLWKEEQLATLLEGGHAGDRPLEEVAMVSQLIIQVMLDRIHGRHSCTTITHRPLYIV